MLSIAIAQYSLVSIAIRYVLPVMWIMLSHHGSMARSACVFLIGDRTAEIPTIFCNGKDRQVAYAWWIAHRGQNLLYTIVLLEIERVSSAAEQFSRCFQTSQEQRLLNTPTGRRGRFFKAAFHDTYIDTDTDTDVLAKILARKLRMSDVSARILTRILARMSMSVSWNAAFMAHGEPVSQSLESTLISWNTILGVPF